MNSFPAPPEQAVFEKIENYLLDQMNAQEREIFESEMSADPDLLAEVQLHRRLIAAVEAGSFTREHDPAKTSGTKNIFRINFRWWYAVAAALLLFAGFFWLYKSNENTPARLYAQNFTADPGLPTEMGITTDYAFNDGMVSYREGDYRGALKKWQHLAKSAAAGDTLRYYIAMAHMNLDQPARAITQLNAVAQSAGELKTNATWYLALAYLREGRREEAITWLEKIAEEDRAAALLKKLKD
ncbi:MAG: hypothetical protein INR69_12300 [Mucilaginibacter polytrichastri]|nr:hypothetical protein [Mucilaginibacter polytrichastri]